jgi:hypothetical protein
VLARLADPDPAALEIGAAVTIELRPNEPEGIPVPYVRTGASQ